MERIIKTTISMCLVIAIFVMTIPVAMAEGSGYPGDIRWDFVTDIEGITATTATIESVADGIMKVKSNGANPQLLMSGLDIDMNEYKYIRVRMKDHTSNPQLVFYFLQESGYANLMKLVLPRERVADTGFVEYVADLSTATVTGTKQDSYQKLRFDFMTNITGGVAEIDYIVLSKYDSPQTSEVIADIKIGGLAVNEFDSASEYCETLVDFSAYSELSPENIDVTLADGYEEAEVNVSVKQLTDRKYVDITVNKGNESRSYRIACQEKAFYTGDIRWDFASDDEGFETEYANIVSVADGIMKVEPDNSDDPRIVADGISINMDEHKYLRIRLKNNSDSAYMQFYLLEENGYNNRLVYKLDMPDSGNLAEYKTYSIHLESFTPEQGTVQNEYKRFRVDFMNLNARNEASTGNVEIDYIVIGKYDREQTTDVLSGVEIGGVIPAGFDSSSEYSEVEIYDDIFDDLSEDDIVPVFADGYESSACRVKVTEVGNASDASYKKYVDITVNLAGTELYRSYRLVCTPVSRPGAVNDYPGDIRWDFTTDEEGFVTSNAIIDSIENGVMKISTDNSNDPQIIASNLMIDMSEYKYIRIRMKDCSNSPNMQFYLLEAGGYNNRLYFNLDKANAVPDNDFKIYTASFEDFVVESGTEPNKVYNRFRFDFMNSVKNGYVEIDYIVISKFEYAPTVEMLTSVTVGDNIVNEFDGEKDYFKTQIYDDVYDGLSEEDVNVQFGSGYEDADVKVRIKEITNRKVIDITVLKNRFTRDYRIVCESVARPVGIVIDECSADEYVISFSGNVKNEAGNPVSRPVMLVAHEKGCEINYQTMEYMGVIEPNENGNFDSSIMLYDAETVARDCQIELLFDILGEDMPVAVEVRYINNTTLDESVTALKVETATGILEYMSENEDMFERMNVWLDLYNALNENEKILVNTAIEPYRNTLTRENASEIANGTILAVMTGNTSASEMIDYVSDYDENVKAIEVENTRFSKLDNKTALWVMENVLNNKPENGYSDWMVFYQNVRASMFLHKVNNCAYTKLNNLLLANTDILDDEMTKLKNEKSTDIVKAAMRIIVRKASETEFTDVKNLVESVNRALDEAKKSAGLSGGGGGSSGGGGGGSSSSEPSKGTNEVYFSSGTEKEESNTENNEVFTDLYGYEWAKDSILSLYEKGIVSGTGVDKFEPGRVVTREEFIKLVCETFGFGKGIKTDSFNDVSENSWFNEYVSKAVEMGIVKGISEKMFGSGNSITREDMAVIIYRALQTRGINMHKASGEFVDADAISDYAKDAVGMLCGEGIINGVGDGMFAPKNPASRAEAAVIFSRCIERFSL